MALIETIKENSSKPAPRWFRKFKKIFTHTENTAIVILMAMGHGEGSMILLLVKTGTSWLLETLETVLANGEEYAKSEA